MGREVDILDDISERELEILALLKERLTNTEIADRLFLATSTVKWYIKQLNSKLDTNNRYEIVEQAEKLGLLDMPQAAAVDAFQHPVHNLPRQTTPFIGRDRELDELFTLLSQPEVRLLTILAPGGMGKTRIALELAEQQLSEFRDGVCYIGLQSVDTASQILPEIAVSLGFRLNNDTQLSKREVLDFLRDKEMLFLLDNFESVLEASDLVNDILIAAPDVKILVTSGERLNLLAETTYILQGMQIPDTVDMTRALEYDAVQLLVQTAQRLRPGWSLENNLEAAAHVCRLTEGMPLGILLAASWLDVYTLDQICTQIQQDIDILETELRDLPERQRSIRAVFNYSWEHLKAPERDVLRQVSVFRSGFTAEAAQAIAGANPRILQSLLSKAIISVDKQGRYHLHKLLRQYAEMKLAEVENVDTVRDKHLRYYASIFAGRSAELYTPQEASLFRYVEDEFDNIRLAWQHALATAQWGQLAQMITPVQQYLLVFGHHMRGIELFRPLLASIAGWQTLSQDQIAAMIEVIYATKFLMQANLLPDSELEALQRRGLAIAREQDDDAAVLKCLRALVKLIRHPDRLVETETLLNEALALARETHNDKLLAKLLLNEALIAYDFHMDRARSLEINQEVITLTRRTGDQRRLAKALSNAAVTQLADGNWERIRQSLQDAEQIARQSSDIQSLLFNLAIQRDLALYRMQRDEAVALQDELTAIEYRLNVPWRQYTHNYRQFFWLFLQEDYAAGLRLWQETESLQIGQSPYPLTNIPHGALYAGMLGDDEAYFTGVRASLARAVRWHDVPRIIYVAVPLLRICQQRAAWESCAQLLSAIMHYRNTWELVRQHPYVRALPEQLEAELGADRFRSLWEASQTVEIPALVLALVDDLAAGD